MYRAASCCFLMIVIIVQMCEVFGSRGQQCAFGYTTVDFCEWTPWAAWNCTGCCRGDANVTRHRGLCCGKMLDDDDCLFSCGLTQDQSVRDNTEPCTSACDCSTSIIQTNIPGSHSHGTEICFKDESLVMQCNGGCKERDDWGKCIHDCGNNFNNKICLIKNISLFILGLIVGIIITTIIYCILNKKQESLQKDALDGAKKMASGGMNQIMPSKPSMNMGF